mgnify:CR=1 FL=1
MDVIPEEWPQFESFHYCLLMKYPDYTNTIQMSCYEMISAWEYTAALGPIRRQLQALNILIIANKIQYS